MADIDKDAISQAYEDVRDDGSEITWAFVTYDDNKIVLQSTGVDYAEFISKFEDDQRAFGFARIQTGDEMSRRSKFVMITWIGPEVGPMKRAKVSTDKAFVKQYFQNFAKEIQTSERAELDEGYVRQELIKAGGANYGTGQQGGDTVEDSD